MANNKKELIELYKTTRDEFHHHDAVYIHVCTGASIVLPIFLGVISLLFSGGLSLGLFVTPTKSGIFGLAIILSFIFWWQIARSDARIKACKEVTQKIEKLLNATSEFSGLLVGEKVDRGKLDTSFLGRRWPKFTTYTSINVIALAGLWLFLFQVI